MLSSQTPTKFQIPFANGAGAGFIRPIPQSSQIGITTGAASLVDGFPPVCFQPVGAGGTPPSGQDFNGVLNLLSAWSRWTAAGGPMYYDATFAAAVSGYPKGAVLQSTTTTGNFWISTVDGNTSNPDTGGANWIGYSVILSGQITNIYNSLINNFPSIQPPRNILLNSITHGSGTATVPANVTQIYYEVLGAGGGGAGTLTAAAFSGGGGASGGFSKGWLTVTPGAVISYTVGQGGAGAGGADGATGSTGGTSSITLGGTTVSATGGGGGVAGSASSAGGTPGLGSGGQINYYGAAGGDGNDTNRGIQGGPGGASAYGGGGRTSTIGHGGSAASDGLAPGSGGGGIWQNGVTQIGGYGADGSVMISY